jgi:hypothetical protein
MCDVAGGPRIAVQNYVLTRRNISLLFSHFVIVHCALNKLKIVMASFLCPRIILRASRRAVAAESRLLPGIQRCYSSKHPKGFVPPTQEDLTELRERVQEFTR